MKNISWMAYVLSVDFQLQLTNALAKITSNVTNIERSQMSASEETKTTGIKKRGFASMDPEKQRAIASKGGKAAHAKGTAHEWNSEEATIAGAIGGKNSWCAKGK